MVLIEMALVKKIPWLMQACLDDDKKCIARNGKIKKQIITDYIY